MAERPDLEKLLDWLSEKEQAGEYEVAHASLEILIAYCRELEAENKRLSDRCVELADEFQIELHNKMEILEKG